MSPDRDAIWFDGATTSHGTFAERVRRTASALAGLGLVAGERVAWIGGNHPSALETLYACGQLGAIWVPVNARLAAPEVRYILEHSGASIVVHGREHTALADALRTVVHTWIATEPPPAKHNGQPPAKHDGHHDGEHAGEHAWEHSADSVAYEQLLAAADPEYRDHPVALDDPCLIMYTSGTTGRPKGAVLTHGNMTWNAVNQSMGMDFTSTERTLALAPLFHIGGLNGTVNPTLLRGGCAVIVRRFDPAETLRVISEQRVNSFFAVPTMLDAMSRQPEFRTTDLSALRTIGAAGAPLPLPTLRTWLDRGVTLQQAYGMTEAAPGCTMLDSADAVRKVGSAGKPVFFTDVRIVRPDGTDTDVDEVGEILVQGPNVMAGYWNDPERTAEVFHEGWYRTGDAGAFDDEGYLYVRDRYRDMIISGGENIYPAEVESALLELPGVVEAAVIGVPDDTWGEVGLAVLVLTPDAERDAEAVRAALRERLAGFKLPKLVEFVDELPKTATGKIRKPDLRDRYARGRSAN